MRIGSNFELHKNVLLSLMFYTLNWDKNQMYLFIWNNEY
jgi:hypothetical protein